MRVVKMGLLMALLLIGIMKAAPAAESAPLQQQNLLTNPGFERPYSNGAAAGWGRWHEEFNANPKPENCSEYYSVRPGWFEENNNVLLTEGFSSQHIGNQFDTWHAGVVQDVNVNPGSRYRFSAQGWGRASNQQFPAPSDTGVNMRIRVGIDPNGGGLWSSPNIVWGAEISPHGVWQAIPPVEATANGGKISVFISADFGGANQCRAHLDAWFDNASLVEAGPPPTNTPAPTNTLPPPPPPPPITNTPVPPTATATPENSPTPTNTPLPTSTATPSGGVICLNAFIDDNGNGVQDATEGYMGNVTFTVSQNNSIVSTGVSRGTDSDVCFENIAPGTYVVAQSVPNGLAMTTAATATIDVEPGRTIGVEFGSRLALDEPTPDDGAVAANPTPADNGSAAVEPTPAGVVTDNSAAPDEGFDLLAISGLIAIILAVVLLAALVLLLLRQQRV